MISPLVREILLKGLMAGTAVRQAKKKTMSFAYYAVAGSIGLMACVFFAIGGYALLMDYFSRPLAAAITGGVLMSVALIVGVTGYFSIHHKKLIKKPVMNEGGFLNNVENTMKSIFDGFEEPIKDNPKMALLMAALAGFAAGDQLGEKMGDRDTTH